MPKAVVSDVVNVKVTLRHSNNHTEIEEYARNAVIPMLKIFPGITSCHIILDHQKNDFEKNKLAEIRCMFHRAFWWQRNQVQFMNRPSTAVLRH